MKYYIQTACTILLFLFITMTSDAAVVYVDIDAASGGDGTSWASALDNIEDAICYANNGDEIWTAEGEYEEYNNIYKDLEIYDGFDGSEILFSQRDVLTTKPHYLISHRPQAFLCLIIRLQLTVSILMELQVMQYLVFLEYLMTIKLPIVLLQAHMMKPFYSLMGHLEKL